MILSKEINKNLVTLCEICKKRADDQNQNIIKCHLCKCQVHEKCNSKNPTETNKIDITHDYAICFQCKNEIFPLQQEVVETLVIS